MENLTNLGLCVAASLVVFIVCLQLAFWWFKIGPRMKMQEETNRLLKKIAGEQ
jgi:hypothetical protein